ncbi:IS200/IS605 family transposase [Bacteroidales bacterium OttesenSCG-928-B11]|nr:IS200/IS605 family transposase [Bacteroidales bacterium OttesenSCG-928-E04]MDL2312340.1 IS200/IS605 family transposase [Bacteroidales bacterium OttesenSCG-928-B11]
MSQSLSKLSIHLVFHIKYNSPYIKKENKEQLLRYINGIIQNCQSIPIAINGTRNHIHILCVMSKNISLKDLVNKIKSNSSRWLRKQDTYYEGFHWQGGYGAFSVSSSLINKTKKYIDNQEAHHKKIDSKNEYLLLLNKHEMGYDQSYLFDE